MKRASGVLLHISSLWGEYGTGSIGKPAREFVDFLSDCGFSYWQTLPVCIPDGSFSPYKSPSAFALNPFLIDLEDLFEKGLITKDELETEKQKTPYSCEFSRLESTRYTLLFKAASRVENKLREKINGFINGRPQIKYACEFLSKQKGYELFGLYFTQYVFYVQWMSLKDYANGKGIKLIGDIPIYVAPDSADVTYNPTEFLLDKENKPSCVAGVPPDYFSEKGQLWGNPLYNWDRMKENGFAWWRERLRLLLELFDGVRIDHFRAVESYWCLPADAEDARVGKWVKGPGMDFVNMLKEEAGDKLIIAEDLGDITKEVIDLVNESGFPGMRVFQFGFPDSPDCTHKPHNYVNNCVAYTGTHDNNTLLGYLFELDENTRRDVFDYIGEENSIERGCEKIIRQMLSSSAGLCIFPIQDLLYYGADTRMNIPGLAEGNWSYRVTKEQIDGIDRSKLKKLNSLYGRY